jgi:hypothetical protein
MNMEDFLKLIGILVIAVFVIHYFIGCVQVQTSIIEGLTNPTKNKFNASTTKISPFDVAGGGDAFNYAATIKAKCIQLQDELLISKYRKDYETAIINMDDYVNMLMLKQVLSMNSNIDNQKANIEVLNTLNILKNSKDALNATMKFIDTQ